MSVTGGPSDAEVVARVLSGDREAFGVVIGRYEPGLLRYAAWHGYQGEKFLAVVGAPGH